MGELDTDESEDNGGVAGEGGVKEGTGESTIGLVAPAEAKVIGAGDRGVVLDSSIPVTGLIDIKGVVGILVPDSLALTAVGDVVGIDGVVIGRLNLYNSDIFSISKKGENVLEVNVPLLISCSVSGDQTQIALEVLCNQFGWTGQNQEHPDLHWFGGKESPLKIEEVRDIHTLLGYRPVGKQTFIILLNLETASVPAQQALLKMLEEPPDFARWLLLTCNISQVLPTIQSRSLLIEQQRLAAAPTQGEEQEVISMYQKITTGSVGAVILLTDRYSDRGAAATIVSQLIEYLHAQPSSAVIVKHLKTLVQTQAWLAANVNVKLALGECFLALRTV